MMTTLNGNILLAICAGNLPVTGEFPTQRPVTWSFHVFFDLRLNKRSGKQWSGWWFETPSHPLWRHCNDAKSTTNGATFVAMLMTSHPGWWLAWGDVSLHDGRHRWCQWLYSATQSILGIIPAPCHSQNSIFVSLHDVTVPYRHS